jgi:hypothetical protein
LSDIVLSIVLDAGELPRNGMQSITIGISMLGSMQTYGP